LKTDPESFIRANTSLMTPPHVPEIRLHLASEAHELWLKTEEELEDIGLPPPFWAFAWAGGQGLARYILDHPAMVADRTVLDFDFTSDDIIGRAVDADVVLAGDVFYDHDFAASLVPWLWQLAGDGKLVLVGDPGRTYLPKNRLEARATYQVPVTRALEDSDIKKTTVWRFLAE